MQGVLLSQLRRSRSAYARPSLPSQQSQMIKSIKSPFNPQVQHMRRKRIGLENFELEDIFITAYIESMNISGGSTPFGPIGDQGMVLSDTYPNTNISKTNSKNKKPTYLYAGKMPVRSTTWKNSPFA